MTDIRKNFCKATLPIAVSCALAFAFSAPVQADGAGAFLGGIAVAKIGSNIRDERDYEEDQAYYAQQQAEAAQQQAAQTPDSPEAKLAQLDSMLKKGYITQAEYDAKKKQILASM